MQNIQHVFFDLDHTLWDFEKNSDLTFQKIFKMNDLSVDLHSFLEVYRPLNFKFWKLYREEKVTKSELRYGRLKNTFDALNFPISDTLIYLIADQYIEHLADFNHLFDGAIEILDYLNQKYTLHIITNGFEEIQTKKMINSKIYHYFEKVITSESVGVKKPNPKVFKHALEIANANIDQAIMIGDSIEADINGALGVGMKAIHCNFDTSLVPNNLFMSVSSLLEIKKFI
ncbi:MAG: YjjG family noncanonical pyrimidine nucleotidase [Polaribacter sp.]|nr:YjjG family noncanonical pyrimidine nucleotidase [Polaribacter sp.]MDG1451389.1 YjjG family noncanonical pyrimidine nucleotidase [Polaribacter sp.]